MICTSFCVDVPVSMHRCVPLKPVPAHCTPNVFCVLLFVKQSLPHGAASRYMIGVWIGML